MLDNLFQESAEERIGLQATAANKLNRMASFKNISVIRSIYRSVGGREEKSLIIILCVDHTEENAVATVWSNSDFVNTVSCFDQLRIEDENRNRKISRCAIIHIITFQDDSGSNGNSYIDL